MPGKRRPARTKLFNGDSTKERILAAALGLFVARGINNVSLRSISEAAGCRNTRACQYHFKDQPGLMSSLLEHIRERIWSPSECRLAEAMSNEASLREVLSLGLWPMKMAPYEFDLGADTTLLLLYCAFDPDPVTRDLGRGCTEPHLKTFYHATRQNLLTLPDDTFNQRWAIFLTEALAGQASRIHEFQQSGKATSLPSWAEHEEYLAALIDFSEGGFQAQVTEST